MTISTGNALVQLRNCILNSILSSLRFKFQWLTAPAEVDRGMGDIHHPKQNAGSAWEKVAPFIPRPSQGPCGALAVAASYGWLAPHLYSLHGILILQVNATSYP